MKPISQRMHHKQHLSSFKDVCSMYMAELRIMGVTRTDYRIIKSMKQTRIRFSSEIIPMPIINRILEANEEKKYQVAFEFNKIGFVDVVLKDYELIPHGQGFIFFVLAEALHHQRRPRQQGMLLKIAKTCTLPRLARVSIS